MDVKQVIVMRTDLNMRKGKMIAQGAHASMAWLSRKIQTPLANFSKAEAEWMTGLFTKVCVRANSEEELLDVYAKAKQLGLTTHLIEDSGLTEFHGIPTKTCLAIGPDYSYKIDAVTGDLKLL